MVLAAVFLLISVMQVGNFRLQIWHVMLFGAIAVLVFGQISLLESVRAVNLDVILFLFGMFIIGKALEESGYLVHLSGRLFKGSKSADGFLLVLIFSAGLASALLMNDTIAVIGTPLVLLLSSRRRIPPKPLLLALAFSITIGSVMSPVGNPQNLLIAVNGQIDNPFAVFLGFLFIPTIINLFLLFFLIRLYFRGSFSAFDYADQDVQVKDNSLSGLCKVSLCLVVILVALKISLVYLSPGLDFKLTYISLVAAAPILLFSGRRIEMVRG